MNYYYDCEFVEGTQKKRFFGIPFGNAKPTIDLISIGIVAEDGREYYAISKDFNLKEAWNRYDLKPNMDYKTSFGGGSDGHYNPQFIMEYWIRENVLRPIWEDMLYGFNPVKHDIFDSDLKKFSYRNFKKLLSLYGKSNKQIAEEIKDFVFPEYDSKEKYKGIINLIKGKWVKDIYMNPVIYGYYSAYDHVALCWLFGKMIDLPKGFPMYTRDLKQELYNNLSGDIVRKNQTLNPNELVELRRLETYDERLDWLKKYSNYFPKQDPSKAHNALEDARWNKQLHEFIKSL